MAEPAGGVAKFAYPAGAAGCITGGVIHGSIC